MEWKIKVRQKGNTDGNYCPLEELDLYQESKMIKGEGSSKNPWILQVELTNRGEVPWEGVIRFELTLLNRDSRFYMPAFLYGRNRGECAANGKWLYPRLREGAIDMPYSPWWMLRSDRLSHPAVFAFEKGQVKGVSGSPYYLSQEGHKRAWMPRQKGDFTSMQDLAVRWKKEKTMPHRRMSGRTAAFPITNGFLSVGQEAWRLSYRC